MHLDIEGIIKTDFANLFDEMKEAMAAVKEYLKTSDIPVADAYDVPADKVVRLIALSHRPELSAWEATQHIEKLKPDVIMVLPLNHFYPETTVIYYEMRQYLHDLLTGQYNEQGAMIVNQNIKKTRKAIKSYLDNYPCFRDIGEIGGRICLFKGAFIYQVEIGPVHWFNKSNKLLLDLVENKNEVSQYNFSEFLETISGQLIDEFIKHDEIMLATNADTREELAKKIYIASTFQEAYPIKRSYSSYELGYLLQEAQHVYEIDILPKKIKALINKGLTQKQIVEQTGVSTTKIRNIIQSIKMSRLD